MRLEAQLAGSFLALPLSWIFFHVAVRAGPWNAERSEGGPASLRSGDCITFQSIIVMR